jgi:hypothetical protein
VVWCGLALCVLQKIQNTAYDIHQCLISRCLLHDFAPDRAAPVHDTKRVMITHNSLLFDDCGWCTSNPTHDSAVGNGVRLLLLVVVVVVAAVVVMVVLVLLVVIVVVEFNNNKNKMIG